MNTAVMTGDFSMIPLDRLTNARVALHGVGEWLMAGPQYQRSGTIRLRVAAGGIATTDGLVSVNSTELSSSTSGSELRAPLQGTIAKLGEAVGLEPTRPDDLYTDHAPITVSDDLRCVSSDVAALLGWFTLGEEALREFAPEETGVLWPEHFDLAISADEVNFGISLGDGFHTTPYAYIGPWTLRQGEFWNAPFGAVAASTSFSDAQSLASFFREGRARAASDPPIAGA